jgi:beta-glucosidase
MKMINRNCMKSIIKPALLASVFFILINCNREVSENQVLEMKVDSLISLMTLDEKIGQLIQENGAEGHDELIKKGRVGSILNSVDVVTNNHLQALAVDSSRLGIPIFLPGMLYMALKLFFLFHWAWLPVLILIW